jgi:hypothetical protein
MTDGESDVGTVPAANWGTATTYGSGMMGA